MSSVVNAAELFELNDMIVVTNVAEIIVELNVCLYI